MGLDESQQDLRQEGHVLMESHASGCAEPIGIFEVMTEPIQITRRSRQHSHHQVAHVPGRCARPEQSGLGEQIVELEEELRRIMPVRMKRKRLREESRELSIPLRRFEKDFPRMESERESESEIQALDAEFKPG